ncbi:MAG TPA: hypothetical protein V6C58_22160 [Allocoleopsis sp.]
MTNEILDEIYQFREDYAKTFNYDVKAMFTDWRERQALSGKSSVTLTPKYLNQEKNNYQNSDSDSNLAA